MEFRLLYQGKLLSDGDSKHKHEVRRHFHPQLRKLWESNPFLASMMDREFSVLEKDFFGLGFPKSWSLSMYADSFKAGSFRFVPLISRYFATACSLNIQLLKPEGSNPLISQSGDIDNRIKTLLDALRIPKLGQEMQQIRPAPEEDPFFCLLEDDSLISGFDVTGDRLLIPPLPTVGHWNNYAVLVIDVKIKLLASTPLNHPFLG